MGARPTSTRSSEPASLGGLLLRAAREHPRRAALVVSGRSVSYDGLLREAAAVARRLRSAGIGHGDRVAVCLERSLEAVAAIHGTLLAGACYVPIDPRSPALRLRRLLRDCRPAAVIADARREAVVRDCGGLAPTPVREDDPAYILYTSGSSGAPKGIVLTHRNALAFVNWAHREFGISPSDRIAGIAPFHFDLSVFDLFNSCKAGAALHLVTYPQCLFPASIRDTLRRRRISVLYTVPSLLAALRPQSLRPGTFPALRLVLFAGEVMPPRVLEAWRRIAPRAEFANLFGPTETNVCAFFRVARSWRGPAIPIGRPVPGTRLVVTSRGRPVQGGTKGELWVQGPTVMKGYVSGAAGAFGRLPGRPGRFYKTGDIVSRDGAGRLLFWGRRDDQVKIRGFRVELGEVEKALSSHPRVREAGAVVHCGQDGPCLSAFVVLDGARAACPESELRRYLGERLPPYMLPHTYIYARTLPRLSNSKLDRQSLRRMLEARA